MNLFLRFFYRFIQGLVWVTFWIYFRRIVFINKETLKSKAPLLVLSNHPNTMIDPLMALYRMRERCFLLANYSLFKNPITNWLLSTLYCIPIQRPKDVEGQPLRNDEAFKQCDTHLQNRGSIYIAAEGSSYTERHVRDFKTGAARIAFSAEEKNNFKLDLRVLLIGITYFDPLKFRKDVFVEVSNLYTVDDWEDAYKTDPRKAIQDITQYFEDEMKKLVIHCRDRNEDLFLEKLETLLQSENPLDTEGVYKRSKKLLKKIHAWEERDSVAFQEFKADVEKYINNLNDLKISDINIRKFNQVEPYKLLVGILFFIYGLINNFIPAWLSNRMIKIFKVDPAYDTTLRYSAGLVFFPLFWGLQTKALYYFFNMSFSWIWYYITLLPTGLLAWWVYTEGSKYFNFLRFKKLDLSHHLSKSRQSLVNTLYELMH